MASRITTLEKERGKTIREIIIDSFNKHQTQTGVAKDLGVTQGTVSLWMMRYGLMIQSVIVSNPNFTQYPKDYCNSCYEKLTGGLE